MRFGKVAAYRTQVGAVQPAILGAVVTVAGVLKLVTMPGDARLLDYSVLVSIHFTPAGLSVRASAECGQRQAFLFRPACVSWRRMRVRRC
jgi:hypothetical protein